MDRINIVHSDPEVLDGEPVFVGTRVPVRTLLLYLESGETLEEFLDNFPTVTKEQAIAFLEEAAGHWSGRVKTVLSADEIQRRLIDDAQNPDAWEAEIRVNPSPSPRPASYRRAKSESDGITVVGSTDRNSS